MRKCLQVPENHDLLELMMTTMTMLHLYDKTSLTKQN